MSAAPQPVSPDAVPTPTSWAWGFVVAALAIQALTILFPAYVPLVDWPNHLGRHALEADWLAGRELPPFYEIDYRVLPNLGGDLVMPLFLRVLEPSTASKLFLVLAVIVYWLGPTVYILQVNNGRPQALWAALLLLPWTFSSQFFWGFLNYYSGLGLAFLLLAHAVRLQRGQVTAWEWLIHAPLVALLFLWHLAAWGIYGILLGSHLIAELLVGYRNGTPTGGSWKRALAFVAVCLPSLMLAAIYISQKTGDGAGETNWGSVVRKLYMPLTLFRGYDRWADTIAVAAWFAALLFLFPEGRRGPASVALSLSQPPWIGFLLLAVLYVMIPFQLGGTSDTDSRLLPAMLVCAVAWLGSQPIRRVALGLAILAICFLVRQGSILRAWHEFSRRLEVHAEVINHLERHSRVLPLVLVPQFTKDYPEVHFPCWAVVKKRAFVPTLFAFRDQQPLRLVSPSKLPVTNTDGEWRFVEPDVRQLYDFVWIYNPDQAIVAVPAGFEKVFDQQNLQLWRVR